MHQEQLPPLLVEFLTVVGVTGNLNQIDTDQAYPMSA